MSTDEKAPKPVSFDSLFGIDEEVATNGVWVNYGQAQVLIGFMGEANKRFVKATEEESRPYKHAIEKESLDNETGRLLLSRIMAKGIVYDWKGFSVPYSVEECLKQLMRKDSLFLREMKIMAEKLATFRQEEAKADEGNSTGAS